MRRWQLILELLLHHTFMIVSLYLCFPLGHSRRLSLVACHFLLSWSRFAENRIILGNVFWQFGPSPLFLGHFFLLGVGLGLDMKWAGVAKFFDSTIAPKNPTVWLLKQGGGFWCLQAYVTAGRVLSPMSARASSPAQGILLTFQCTRRAVINTFMERHKSLRYTRRAFISAFMERRGSSGWGFPWKLGETYFACNSLFELRAN